MGGELVKISNVKLSLAVRIFRKQCLFLKISLAEYFQCERLRNFQCEINSSVRNFHKTLPVSKNFPFLNIFRGNISS